MQARGSPACAARWRAASSRSPSAASRAAGRSGRSARARPQSYWTCIAAQAAEVATSVPATPSQDALKPRNRKPRNAISSVIGATITTATKNSAQRVGGARRDVGLAHEARHDVAPERQGEQIERDQQRRQARDREQRSRRAAAQRAPDSRARASRASATRAPTTAIQAGPATMVTNASRKPSFASCAMSTVPGAAASRHAMKAMTTANCTANHATTPSAPHTIVPSSPHGGGSGRQAARRGSAKDRGSSRFPDASSALCGHAACVVKVRAVALPADARAAAARGRRRRAPPIGRCDSRCAAPRDRHAHGPRGIRPTRDRARW